MDDLDDPPVAERRDVRRQACLFRWAPAGTHDDEDTVTNLLDIDELADPLRGDRPRDEGECLSAVAARPGRRRVTAVPGERLGPATPQVG